jgi:hypothetical protein
MFFLQLTLYNLDVVLAPMPELFQEQQCPAGVWRKIAEQWKGLKEVFFFSECW